ncbi:conserved hypothetical protein, partial [Trichinella spiralis]
MLNHSNTDCTSMLINPV